MSAVTRRVKKLSLLYGIESSRVQVISQVYKITTNTYTLDLIFDI